MAFCSMSIVLYQGSDREKLKPTCDNLGAAYSSDVDGSQLYEKIQDDCKMLFSSRLA